jgi:hypothetical protein
MWAYAYTTQSGVFTRFHRQSVRGTRFKDFFQTVSEPRWSFVDLPQRGSDASYPIPRIRKGEGKCCGKEIELKLCGGRASPTIDRVQWYPTRLHRRKIGRIFLMPAWL